jgi:hypothetical protein
MHRFQRLFSPKLCFSESRTSFRGASESVCDLSSGLTPPPPCSPITDCSGQKECRVVWTILEVPSMRLCLGREILESVQFKVDYLIVEILLTRRVPT